MKTLFNTCYKHALLFASLCCCTACDPVTLAFGGTAAVGLTSVRNQRGVSGSISDTQLQTNINHALVKEDRALFDRIEVSIKHGKVIAIGYMDNENQRARAIMIIRSVADKYNKEVFDEVKVQTPPDASDVVNDSGITSRIKSSLLFDGNVASLNYDITTVKGVVYICGIAQSKFERDVVLNQARTTAGVKRVVAYIEVRKDEAD